MVYDWSAEVTFSNGSKYCEPRLYAKGEKAAIKAIKELARRARPGLGIVVVKVSPYSSTGHNQK